MGETTRAYRDLIVWQKAMQLVPKVYELVKRLPPDERYALSDQIRRAAVSVPANIAEGQARQHAREFAQFLSVARGSLAEVDTLLLVAVDLNYLTLQDLVEVDGVIVEVRRMLQALIQRTRTRGSGD